jgi:hypothetical protein
MNDLIFPAEASLKIEDIEKVGQHIDIYAQSTKTEVSCPDCQTISPSVMAVLAASPNCPVSA